MEVGAGVDECFDFEWVVLVLVVEEWVDVDVVEGATHVLVVVGGGGGGVELVVGFGL